MVSAEQPADAPATRPGVSVRLLRDGWSEMRRWRDYIANAPGATVYHDPAWREIFGALGYRTYPLMALDESTGACRGVLPLYRVPSLIGPPRLVAVPFRDRGGAVFDDAEAFRALLAEAGRLGQREGAARIVLKTIRPYPESEAHRAGLVRSDHWVHSEADLVGLEPNTLLKALGDKTRNMIRHAERAGLRFVEAGEAPRDLDAWMALHRQAQHQLGLPAFPRRFFERMLTLLRPRGLARLFLVENGEGQALAGTIVFVERSRAIYAYSASDRRGRELRANDLMLFRLMTWAIERGIPILDFGSDSPSQKGLLFFKRKWLARQRLIPTYHLGGKGVPIDSSSARYELIRAAVRRLPASLTRALLTPLLRYFG